ncbi:MAG: fatty acyl-AMP ligase [Pyrinomonadaceae bacterium]
MNSIIEVVERHLELSDDSTAFTFLEDGTESCQVLTLEKLRVGALNISDKLVPKSAVLILLPQGLSFVKAFFGCLYARAVAVPCSILVKHQGLERLNKIVRDAAVTVGITNRKVLANLNKQFGDAFESIGINWILIEDIENAPSNDSTRFDLPKPDELAFLQYTSGSTGKPKAVMVTHENIIANSQIIKDCFQNTPESVSVCWLPSFHDMGLIDGIIQPIFSGFPSVLMSPLHFLQKPVRWFRAITDYQATYSGAPNFAFDFCTERITDEELENIDLSSLHCLYNGSEPIRAKTIRRFVERFSNVGFCEGKILTCYGLAEATLAVTTSSIGISPNVVKVCEKKLIENRIEITDNETACKLVSCGKTFGDTELIIIDPETFAERGENEIGEILVSGKSVTDGYLNLTEQTAETFIDYRNERFLRTGDLGFLRQRELFVTGRIKDLIVIRGKNHFPQDIEQSISNCHEAFMPNGCAAFSAKIEDAERLVVVQEIKRTSLQTLNSDVVISAILSELSRFHGLVPYDIVLIKPASLPKTTSGKIRRNECRELWRSKSLKNLASLEEFGKYENP